MSILNLQTLPDRARPAEALAYSFISYGGCGTAI